VRPAAVTFREAGSSPSRAPTLQLVTLRKAIVLLPFILFGLNVANPVPEVRPDPRAVAVLDTTITRMGGGAALAGITGIRREMLTQWQRINWQDHPYADAPSYETHADLRDYATNRWRNSRRIPAGAMWMDIVDVVDDTVAARSMQGNWMPLNITYVDERRELFAMAPERLPLGARAAGELKLGRDTVTGGARHARLECTLEGLPTTLFVRRADGLPAMARYRAAAPNDFGLVPWGHMEVEIWFSQWGPISGGALLPAQWDVRRVGRPYKRMTVLGTTLLPDVPADSFPVTDALRTQYLATATKPMHDLPYDGAKVIDDRFATFGANGAPAGAIKLGGKWWLLEAGQGPLSAERAAAQLRRLDPGTPLGGAMVTSPRPGNGGTAWLARQNLHIWSAPGAAQVLTQVLRGHDLGRAHLEPVDKGRWLRFGRDSAWVEPVDLIDAPGALLIYVPAWDWVYSQLAVSPLHTAQLHAALDRHRWKAGNVGSLRGIAARSAATR